MLIKMPKIIIIEDHPIMCQGLADYFSGTNNWKVNGIASSLSDAKKLLAKTTADIILLDIQLDDGWGLDIISWLQDQPGMQMPVIAVYSTFDDYAHVSAALCLGVKAYITKRRSGKELENALLTTLSGINYIDEAAQVKLKNVNDILSLLNKRESEVLTLVKDGHSNAQMADELCLSRRTVENILSCIYTKTGIKSRFELERL
ncbi:MAG: response regulator transcription factor [Treponema sp.]|nr:response regulator transcription factor [Treponema sp.]